MSPEVLPARQLHDLRDLVSNPAFGHLDDVLRDLYVNHSTKLAHVAREDELYAVRFQAGVLEGLSLAIRKLQEQRALVEQHAASV